LHQAQFVPEELVRNFAPPLLGGLLHLAIMVAAQQALDALQPCDAGHGLARRLAVQGRDRLVGPMRIVAPHNARDGLRGRSGFETLAGDSVRFLLREVSGPKGLLSRADPSKSVVAQAPSLPAGMDPEVLGRRLPRI
jgi:hypothetical protein